MGTKFFLPLRSIFAFSFLFISSIGLPTSLSAQCGNFLKGDTIMADCGDSLTLRAFSGYLGSSLLEDFNDKKVNMGFRTNSNPTFSNPCKPTPDTSTYLWFDQNSSQSRSIRTIDMTADSSMRICFDLRLALQTNNAPCEGPDLPDEGVYFEFSTDSGSSWSKIFYFNPDTNNCGGSSSCPFTDWDNHCFNVPDSLDGKKTRFRWFQKYSTSGAEYDHWGLDDISINKGSPDTSNVYDWGNGVTTRKDSTFLPTDSSFYSVDIIDTVSQDTCTAEAYVGYRPLGIRIAPQNPVKCNNDSVVLSSGCDTSGNYACDSSGIYNYVWDPSTALSDTSSRTVRSGTDTPITYSLMVEDSLHPFCKSSDTVQVDTLSSPLSPKIVHDTSYCEDGTDTLALANTYASVLWNDSISGDSLVVDSSYGTPTQTHQVTVTDSNGCSGSDTVQLQIDPSPDPTILADSSYCLNGSDTLTLSSNYSSTTWNGFTTGDSLIVDKSYGTPQQTHYVRVTDANGCSGRDTVQIWLDTVNTSLSVHKDTLIADQSGASYQWLSCDSGYTPISGATSQSFYPSSNGNYAVVVNDNGCSDTSICKSSLPNSVWTNNGSGVPGTLYAIHFLDSATGWIATKGGRIIYADSSNATVQIDTTNELYSIHFGSDSTGWSVGQNGLILYTDDGGRNGWSTQNSIVNSDLHSVYAVDSNYAWCVGKSGTALHTSDGGMNWNVQSSGTFEDLKGVQFHDRDSGWSVGGTGTVLRTADGGSTWNAQTSGTSNDLADVQFVNDSVGWTVGDNGTILLSEDGGTSWTSQASGTNEDLEAVHFVNDSTGWIVGAKGTILYTSDGRAGWSSQADGRFHDLKDVHFTENGHGWVAGEGGTLLNFGRVVDEPTSIEQELEKEAFVKVYPNPVDERLRIEHRDIEERLSVTLFNKLGQRLKTDQVDGVSNGLSSLKVSELEPGIYFLRFEHEGGEKPLQKRVHKIVVE